MTYTLELIQLIFATHDVFRVYANGWGNFLELDSIGFYWFDIIILTALSESTRLCLKVVRRLIHRTSQCHMPTVLRVADSSLEQQLCHS